MGTRHLTAVYKNGEYKVAQYGQWDGYPSGQGATILSFLRQMDRSVFEDKLKQVSFGTEAELKEQWIECGAEPDKPWVSMDVAKKHLELYPENSRDTGADVLNVIYESERELKLANAINFTGDSLFCEWAYVIDLDKNTFEIYRGFNTEPIDKNERFACYFQKRTNPGEQYYPVRQVKKYDIYALPTEDEFLKDLQEPDEEE